MPHDAHDHGHDDSHDGHDHGPDNHLDPMTARVMALETILTEKGLVDPAALDAIIETYAAKVGPRNGARVVARAWAEPAYADWLRADATAAIADMGYSGRQGEHMRAVFNTEDTHNLVVCTLCSCYPWAVLGLPPVWYKAPPYRARAVSDPRGVLREFGLDLPEATRIRVWDSTAELRYLVIPRRPEGSEGLGVEALADLVGRDAMIGTALASAPEGVEIGRSGIGVMNGPQDLGGQQGFGPVAPERDEPLFHAPWEARAMAVTIASGALGAWTIDESRHARESLPWVTYYRSSYYEIWIRALETLLARHGLVGADERAAGHALRPGPEAPRVLRAEAVAGALARGAPCDRPVTTPARFAAGDRVRTHVMNPAGHTRLPRYARGRVGVVEAVQGGFVFPDTSAHGGGERPEWVYTVVFRAEDLWGADAEPGSEVSIDAWESYLEPA